jgi:hypothetical protein
MPELLEVEYDSVTTGPYSPGQVISHAGQIYRVIGTERIRRSRSLRRLTLERIVLPTEDERAAAERYKAEKSEDLRRLIGWAKGKPT